MYHVSQKNIAFKFRLGLRQNKRIFEILLLVDYKRQFLCVCDCDFRLVSAVFRHYLVKFENPKYPRNFYSYNEKKFRILYICFT